MTTPATLSPRSRSSIEKEVHDKYVTRLRARLSRPKITVEDARDGILDCFVSTYYEGVKQGLEGILGIHAEPDQVAQVASKMFRDRLAKRGLDFDAPTADGLSEVKEELDEEFHFAELPAELSATHDQVCSLLLAKADGLLEHHGDRSVIRAKTSSARPEPRVVAPRPPATNHTISFEPPPPPATPPPAMARRRASSVTTSLREALAAYLEETRDLVTDADPAMLIERLERARTLAKAIGDFS